MGSYVSSLAGRLYQSPEDFLASVSTSGAYSEVSLDDDEDDLEDELASLEGSAFGTPEWKQLIGLIPKPAGLQLQPHYKHEKQDPKHRMGDLLEECFKVYTQQNPGDPDGAQLYQWLDAMSDWDRLMLIANNPLVRDPAKRVEAGLPAGRAAHSDVDRRGNIKPSMVKAFMKGVAYLDKAGRKRRKVIFRGGTAYGVDEKGIEIALDTAQLQTVFSGKGFGIWVMSEKGKLYVGNHIKGLIHHSSFLAGAKVMCGGELKAQTGKIQLLSGKSGHYNPGIEHLVWALNVLRTCVDNFDQIKVVVWRANAVNLVSPGQLIGNAHLYKSWGNLTADEKARLARGDFAGFPA